MHDAPGQLSRCLVFQQDSTVEPKMHHKRSTQPASHHAENSTLFHQHTVNMATDCITGKLGTTTCLADVKCVEPKEAKSPGLLL